jgi:hypothetical protein
MERADLVKIICQGADRYRATDVVKEFLTDQMAQDEEIKKGVGDLDVYISRLNENPLQFEILFRTAIDMLSSKYHIIFLRDSINNLIKVY